MYVFKLLINSMILNTLWFKSKHVVLLPMLNECQVKGPCVIQNNRTILQITTINLTLLSIRINLDKTSKAILWRSKLALSPHQLDSFPHCSRTEFTMAALSLKTYYIYWEKLKKMFQMICSIYWSTVVCKFKSREGLIIIKRIFSDII